MCGPGSVVEYKGGRYRIVRVASEKNELKTEAGWVQCYSYSPIADPTVVYHREKEDFESKFTVVKLRDLRFT